MELAPGTAAEVAFDESDAAPHPQPARSDYGPAAWQEFRDLGRAARKVSTKLKDLGQVDVYSAGNRVVASPWATPRPSKLAARLGAITRDATREEEQRLYQQSGGLRYGLKPVTGSGLHDLDHRRLRDYFVRIRGDAGVPSPGSDEWGQLLCNLGLAIGAAGHASATIDGMLLFGANAGRFVPQSGIRAVCYPGLEQSV